MSRKREGKTDSLNDAVLQAQASSQELAALKAQVRHLQQVVEALWDLLRDRSEGVTEPALRAALEAVRARAAAHTAPSCPTCGRALQRGHKTCIYCSTVVEAVQPLF